MFMAAAINVFESGKGFFLGFVSEWKYSIRFPASHRPEVRRA
jgi:hypothetical protein